MTRVDTEQTLKFVTQLWPRIDWHPDVRRAFALHLLRLPLTYAQAKEELLQVRLSSPYQTCQPSDLLGPLEAVAKRTERSGFSPDVQAESKLVTAYKRSDPAGFSALCEELHRAVPSTPPHYRDVPSAYCEWPVSRAWLAAQIRQRGLLVGGTDDPR